MQNFEIGLDIISITVGKESSFVLLCDHLHKENTIRVDLTEARARSLSLDERLWIVSYDRRVPKVGEALREKSGELKIFDGEKWVLDTRCQATSDSTFAGPA